MEGAPSNRLFSYSGKAARVCGAALTSGRYQVVRCASPANHMDRSLTTLSPSVSLSIGLIHCIPFTEKPASPVRDDEVYKAALHGGFQASSKPEEKKPNEAITKQSHKTSRTRYQLLLSCILLPPLENGNLTHCNLTMSPVSIDMGDEAITSLFPGPFIKSQFRTTTRLPPPGTDLTGNVAIVTGGNSGIGLQAVRHLLSLKLSHLIIAVRNLPKGESAATQLREAYPAAKVDVWPLEMASYPSIQAFVARVDSELLRLDFAILNAGLMKPTFSVCAATGHEETIQVNFLSTFLLAILMLPLCKAKAPESQPGRLTIVSSGTALTAKFPNRSQRPLLASFDTVDPKGLSGTTWDPTDRYFTSKMLGHLLFVRLLDFLRAEDVVVNLVEPGMCKSSDLHRDVGGPIGVFLEGWKNLCGRKPQDGAWTYVDAAVVKGPESHGCFLMDWEIHP